MLVKTLKAHGHTSEEAEDGLVAFGMVKEKGFTVYDAILMDFVMVCMYVFFSRSNPVSLTLRSLPSLKTRTHAHTHTHVHILSLFNSHIPPFLVFSFQPVMDGPDATKVIRDLGYKGPIIGCTGNTLDTDLLRFKESGCDRVIGKPFLPELFHQFMNELTGGTATPTSANFFDTTLPHRSADMASSIAAML